MSYKPAVNILEMLTAGFSCFCFGRGHTCGKHDLVSNFLRGTIGLLAVIFESLPNM